jgi:hypothetical protein
MVYIVTHVFSIYSTFYSQQPPLQRTCSGVPSGEGFAFNNFLHTVEPRVVNPAVNPKGKL